MEILMFMLTNTSVSPVWNKENASKKSCLKNIKAYSIKTSTGNHNQQLFEKHCIKVTLREQNHLPTLPKGSKQYHKEKRQQLQLSPTTCFMRRIVYLYK